MIEFTFFDLFVGIAILAILLAILCRQKKSLSYLFFFSIFWVYLLYVASVIVFPFVIESTANETFKPNLNLMPLYFDSCGNLPHACFRNVIGNILLTMPFGFLINFAARVKANKIPWLAIAVGLIFESIQLTISLIFRSRFRSIDINDVLLNAVGVLLGYGCFRIFGWLYLTITQRLKINHRGMFADIHDIVSQV